MSGLERPADGHVVLTGATGFVGTLVLERLLARPDVQVVALVRAADDGAAQARLEELARVTWGDAAPLEGRVRTLASDLGRPRLGLSEQAFDELADEAGTVVHCAASIDFDLPLAEATAINLDGTRRVLELVSAARARGRAGRLVHVSTAYVHGRADAIGGECDPVAPAYRNTYEETKHAAERAVTALGGDTVIVRPSIVVGDSHTGWTSAYNVIYPTLRLIARRVLKVVPAPPGCVVDLVGVDQVGDVIDRLVARPHERGIVQVVAGETARTMEDLRRVLAEHYGLSELPCDPSIADRLGVYSPYTDIRGRFELQRARELGFRPVPAETLLPRILRHADEARWGRAALPHRPRPVPLPAG